MSVILASKSAARRAVLDGAGVSYEALVAGVDEDAVKASLLAEGAGPRDIADALAVVVADRIVQGVHAVEVVVVQPQVRADA